MNRLARMSVGAIVGAVTLWAGTALAEFPEKPVEFVVSAAAGGGNDTVTRLIAAALEKKWGQPVVVLNKPGAGVTLAEGYVANAKADGYTLLMVNQTRTLNAAKGGNSAGYDMVNALTGVTQVGRQPFVLSANNDFPAKTLPELVSFAKANPNKVTYGDSGRGTSSDLAFKRFMRQVGIELKEIPYRTHSEQLVAQMAGEINLKFGDVITNTPHIKDGKITAIALASDRRSDVLPDLPTFGEALGSEPFEYYSWYGVFVPTGTPKEIVDKLNADIVSVINEAGIRETLVRDGVEVVLNKPDEFEKWMKADTAVWREVMEAFPLQK